MSPKPFRIAAIGAAALTLGPIGGLAQNVASASTHWPGPLDYIRRYAWFILAGTAILSIALFLVERRLSSLEATSQGLHAPQRFSDQRVDMAGAIFNGPVSISQGDGLPPGQEQ